MFTRELLKKISLTFATGIACLATCYAGTYLTLRVFNTTSVDQVWPPLMQGFLIFLDITAPVIIVLGGEIVRRKRARDEALESLRGVSLDEAIHRASWEAAEKMMDEMDESYSPPVRKWLHPVYEFFGGIGIGAAFRIGNALYVTLWALSLFFLCEMIQEGWGKPRAHTTSFEIQYRVTQTGQRMAGGCILSLFCMEGWLIGILVALLSLPVVHMGEIVGKELHWILDRKKSTT